MKAFKGILLVGMVLAQLYILSKMAWDSEMVLENGKTYKFKCAPVDPADPFKGRYVLLNYKDASIELPEFKIQDLNKGDAVFVTFIEDENGYAKIKELFKTTDHFETTQLGTAYLKAKIERIGNVQNIPNLKKVHIRFPFNKYYMEENKAPIAEKIYRDLDNEKMNATYALVLIKNSNSVLKNVIIDGNTLVELASE